MKFRVVNSVKSRLNFYIVLFYIVYICNRVRGFRICNQIEEIPPFTRLKSTFVRAISMVRGIRLSFDWVRIGLDR